jgi:hypothetical protein
VNTFLGCLCEAGKGEVAGGDLVPGARNTNLRLVPVVITHTNGTKHAPGGGGFNAIGNHAGAGLNVENFHENTLP